jgi:hypothetical protein
VQRSWDRLVVSSAVPARNDRDSFLTATSLATAAITTEAFGELVGSSAGAGLASVSDSIGISRNDAFALAYLGFAAVLAIAVIAGVRSATPKMRWRSPPGA